MADQMEVDMIVKAISQGFDKVSKDITDVGKATDTAGKSAETASGGIGKMAGAMKMMAGGIVAGAGVAVVAFGKQAVAAASNVEEAASKFQAVFGPAAEEAGRALDEFGAAVGRSGYELRETAAGFGAILEGLLGSKQAAAEASVELAKLTTDISSFYNVSESDAAMALTSALAGQTEPMRKFGVMLSAAAIEAEVFSSGMAKTKDEITNAMKAQATMNLIMEGTATAQGDAARTSDSYANQQRALGAAILDLQVVIGTGLIPTMKTLTGVAIEAAGGLKAFFEVAGNGGDIVQGIVEQNIQQATSVKDLTEQYKRIQTQLGMWGGAAAAITGTQDDLIASSQEVAEAVLLMAGSSEEYVAAAKEMGIVGTSQGQMSEDQAAAFYDEAKATLIAAEALERMTTEASGADAAMLDNVSSTQGATEASEGHGLALQRLVEQYKRAAGSSGEFVEKTGQSAEALAAAAESASAAYSIISDAIGAAADPISDYYQAQQDIVDSQGEWVGSFIDNSEQIGEVSQQLAQDLSGEQVKAWEEILAASEEGGAEWQQAYSALQGDLTESQRNELIARQNDLAAANGQAMSYYTGDAAAYEDAQAAKIEANNAVIASLKETAMATIESQVTAAVAAGEMTAAAGNAYLAGVGEGLGLLSEDEAAAQLAVGNASLLMAEQLSTGLERVKESGEEMAQTIGERAGEASESIAETWEKTEESTEKARTKAANLDAQLQGMVDKKYTIVVETQYTTTGSPPSSGGGGASGGSPGGQAPPSNGGSPNPNAGYATGTNGWQTVPAGYPNDSYNVRMQSGERFAVVAAGQGGMGGSVVNQTFISNTRESQALAWAQAEQLRRARMDRM